MEQERLQINEFIYKDAKNKLRKDAEENGRSLTRHILYILKSYADGL